LVPRIDEAHFTAGDALSKTGGNQRESECWQGTQNLKDIVGPAAVQYAGKSEPHPEEGIF
jgi:hypothetical protein